MCTLWRGTEQGAQSLVGLIPEAFHATEDLVTGVQARNLSQEEQDYIVLHARFHAFNVG